jgi:heparan-alpha-glucosaminide N-acetyltransferase
MTSLLTRTQPTGQPQLPEVTAAAPKPEVKPARLVSLDAYRGFIMLAMASGGLAIPTVVKTLAEKGQDSPLWRFLAFHTDHVPWIGCSFWDLIQPSFMFMVGVAIPFSYASRRARGDSKGKILFHAIWRALLLVLLAVFLSSSMRGTAPTTNWLFTNVLAQIGLGYVFVFLLHGQGLRVQLGAVAALFVGYTLLFGLYRLPPADFDYASVRSLPEQLGTTGWFAHWNKNTNAAAAFDVWFLNLFPRPKPFEFEPGGYQTLNFVPSMITMILGLMAGEMLRGPRSRRSKLGILIAAGLGCLALGYLAGMFVCPIVKRIWTPSWAVYSAGWTFLLLAAFYLLIDVAGWRRWAFVFVVVGMNSIAMYCMAQLMKGWVRVRLKMHLNPAWFEGTYGPIISAAAVLLVLWLVCLWMYRRKLFLRI